MNSDRSSRSVMFRLLKNPCGKVIKLSSPRKFVSLQIILERNSKGYCSAWYDRGNVNFSNNMFWEWLIMLVTLCRKDFLIKYYLKDIPGSLNKTIAIQKAFQSKALLCHLLHDFQIRKLLKNTTGALFCQSSLWIYRKIISDRA